MSDEPTGMEVDINRLGAQGDGVWESEAGARFVPFALPGERVMVEQNADRIRLIEVVTPCPDRIEPACRHFITCGGCVAQHMARALYLEWKRDAVRQAFARRGLTPEIAEVISVPPASRRRAVLEARSERGTIQLGFHTAASHDLVDLAECPVLLPVIPAALPALRRLAAGILPSGSSARLTITAAREGLDVGIDAAVPPLTADRRAALARIALDAGLARLMLGREMIAQRVQPTLELGGVAVELPPGAFTQASAEAEQAIAALIKKATAKAKRVADLFCGLGTFTFGLARRATVLAMDSDKPAINALAKAARAPGLKRIETRVRDLMREPLSRKELEGIDAVVFDPPRAGAEQQARMLARSEVAVIVAVSCNPATLARDARILVDAGYAIDSVTPIDQFVWSPHVEAVAIFRRQRR